MWPSYTIFTEQGDTKSYEQTIQSFKRKPKLKQKKNLKAKQNQVCMPTTKEHQRNAM